MSGNSRFKKLLEPYHIRPVKTRNRMIKTAAGTSFWDPGEHRISEKGKAFYEAITTKGLTIVTQEGERQTIEADTIIPAIPLTPNTKLLKSLESKVPEIYAIGDGWEPRLIPDAVADGWQVANSI
jgi:pyruvate/2-oxoglutarate dehydrogenase complex dihydrolipoamide dehydrogenase (E3) component